VVTFGRILGVVATLSPNRNIAPAKVIKLTDIPLNAPNIPASIHTTTRVRLTPNQSANKPPGNPINTPARGSIPQMTPTDTRLRPKSSDICLKSTGIHIREAPGIRPFVNIVRPKIYHGYFEFRFFSITKVQLLLPRLGFTQAIPASINRDSLIFI
jgi:hypothetical protein